MLSNSDFKSLLSKTSNGNDGKEKTRFDLKQVEKWDKEINKKHKIVDKKSKSFNVSSSDKSKDKDIDANQSYRDRALERRKNEGKEDPNDLEVIASALDMEKTKYLGGDIEHTHLVKGLDYALLRRIQIEQEKSTQLIEAQSEIFTKDLKSLNTTTAFGSKIRDCLVTITSAASTNNSKKLDFNKIAFEFDIDPASLSELPIIVTSSSYDMNGGQSMMIDNISNELIDKVKLSFERIRDAKLKKKQKQQDDVVIPVKDTNQLINSQPAKPVVHMDDDIYGGILDEKVDKYIPVGAIHVDTTSNHSLPQRFSGDTKSSSSFKSINNEDLLKPVQDLLTAQLERDNMIQKRLEEAAERSRAGNSTTKTIMQNDSKAGMIHRGIFDVESTIDIKKGEAMGKGTFDMYSNINDFELIVSDDDDYDDRPSRPTKRFRKKK